MSADMHAELDEAAKLLGMSRTHLIRLCDEGLVASFHVGSALTQEQADMVRATERAAFRNLADAVCNEMERRWSA